jgi:acetate kinase
VSKTVLTLNAGSSSIKFALFGRRHGGIRALARGQLEGIAAGARLAMTDAEGRQLQARRWPEGEGPGDAGEALHEILPLVAYHHDDLVIDAVGHRVVHGGPDHDTPIVVDDAALERLRKLMPLAPLHQPHNLAGIETARAVFPDALQVACFDTAFHRSHPWVNDVFALPRELYDEGVRRYGFHGLSYEYVTRELARVAPHHASGRVVVAHLGSGASMCAIRDGHSVGSTMGFSALDGLPMGTRCGQVDPGVLLYLLQSKGMTPEALTELLYRQSGLRGLSGISHDMRELQASNDAGAQRAIDYFVFRVRRELGAMAAILGGLDALVFTGGIGENAVHIRERVCSGFEWLGIEIDSHRNREGARTITSDRSRCRVLVIRTDEERVIAEAAFARLDP